MRIWLPILILAWCTPVLVCAQDIVITRSKSTSKNVKRKGEIVEWKGSSLTLSANGKQKNIDNGSIVQIQTNWNQNYTAGREALDRFQFDEAIAKFNVALQQETRPWAVRLIRARLVEAFRGSQNNLAAVQQFLTITQEDPQTRFFHLIPLAWTTSSLESVNVVATAKRLADSRDITAKLIAASWLLNDSQDATSRNRAIKMLEQLVNDIEPKVAQLATSQLWRTQIMFADQNQVNQWSARAERFDSKFRFGANFVIAEAQSRLGKNSQAAINYMSVPILYPEQHSIIPAALYKCGDALQNAQRGTEAVIPWKELVQKYPDSLWAKQAASRIPSRN